LNWEKELLGMYISSHPLDEFAEKLKTVATPIKSLIENNIPKGTIGGIINTVKKIITKKGDQMAFIDVEDTTGSIEVVIFASIFNQQKDSLIEGKIVLINGKLSDKDGEPKFIAEDLKEFNEQTTLPLQNPTVTIKIPEAATDDLFEQLKQLFQSHPGDLGVNLMIKEQKIKTPFRVNLNDDLKSKIQALLRS
jgi:DNA polymerase-3 subunit alpha